jgi:hypothetical protein
MANVNLGDELIEKGMLRPVTLVTTSIHVPIPLTNISSFSGDRELVLSS